MTPEAIAILAALGGTLSGGFVTYLSGRNLKDREWKLGLLRDRLRDREKLYADFLVNAQRLVMKAMESKIQNPTELDIMNNEFARIEMVAAESIVEAARKICNHILIRHSQDSDKDEKDFFELKQAFIESVRKEFSSLEKV